MNWPAARLAAALTVLLSGRPAATWRAWRDDARKHPSPNAGQIEAAFAGALGVQLGGTLAYAGRVEHRPQLGDGRDPGPADIARAIALARRISLATALLAAMPWGGGTVRREGSPAALPATQRAPAARRVPRRRAPRLARPREARMSVLVAGTASDAGKSVITAAICRWLTRQGLSVAPFKAQNMALNSTVTASGAEIGRAQAMQAAACGIEPEAAMNPVLIKPSGRHRSQVLLMGKPYANATARSYQDLKPELREPVIEAYNR